MAGSILIVEDEEALSELLEYNLASEGFQVRVSADGDDAMLSLDEDPPDLMLLDWMLPGLSGIEICRRVRARAEMRDMPIIMMTARGEETDRVRGLDTGADDYLTKPFDFPELAARVRALLRRPAEASPPVLEVGDIRLDPASHTVWRGALVVPLTAREFSLLEYLMRRPAMVLSRSELLEHVWDANYDGLSNVVDVHIANLRRKLDVADVEAPIETVRGVGYQILVTS